MKQVIFNTEHPKGFVEEAASVEIPKDLKIMQLKQKLSATDYQAIKYAEGWISEEEYAPIRAERQKWRDEINALEQSLEKEVEACSN